MDYIKIFAVDDAQEDRRVYYNILSKIKELYLKMDFQVLASAETALSIIEDCPASSHGLVIVIIDVILLGGMDGVEFARKCLLINPEIKIIFISAYRGFNDNIDFISTKLKIDDFIFLRKPVDQVVVSQVIKSVVSQWEHVRRRYVKTIWPILSLGNIETRNDASDPHIFFSAAILTLKTPLSVIIANIELLHEILIDHRYKEIVDCIYRSSKHLMFIIKETLSYSLAKQGGMPNNSSVFNVCKLVDDCTLFNSAMAAKSNIAIKITIDKNLPKELRGSANLISQVLNNLISNAIKFSRNDSKIFLRVLCKNMEGSYVKLVFEVEDFGEGITEEDKKLIFTPFVSVDHDSCCNVGLGLLISKVLIENMGGIISFDSRLGQGSVFYFELGLEIPN